MTAYLVVRQDNKWRDVYRLTPGQVMTIGRAPTNRLVLRDEVCSRNHCEVFLSGEEWYVRDLGSRNGTMVGGKTISGDHPLQSGAVLQVGASELAFTYDLSLPLPELPEPITPRPDHSSGVSTHHNLATMTSSGGPEILHRQSRTRFEAGTRELGRDRTSRDLARMYRLALDMGNATTPKALAGVVLDGLMAGIPADIGAFLVLPPETAERDPGRLSVIAYKSRDQMTYERVSDSLSQLVLSENEAVLARDMQSSGQFTVGDSVGDLQVKSVICAPLRRGETILGLIHLYSTQLDAPLGQEDLEFTLAVADQCAVVLEGLQRRESLVDGLERVSFENKNLREQLELESELIGGGPYMGELKTRIARIAPTDATVLIRGESGVGKELVARAMHYGSGRRTGPFVCMNCAALSESLLESELFGHEKGSFTGAVGRKVGKFEQANNGSIFLDEVGEMTPAVQAKFLRVLEGHPFDRVGGGAPVKVDVRVIAATNRDLEKAVEQGTFRKDLYYRLHVVELRIRPLREHPEDVSDLARYFLDRYSRRTGRGIRGFSPEALRALRDYDWPGNIRELQNTIERAVILGMSDQIDLEDLQLSRLGGGATKSGRKSSAGLAPMTVKEVSLDDLERKHILAILESTAWNKSQAAQILGIERSTLDRKLKRYQVNSPKSSGGGT